MAKKNRLKSLLGTIGEPIEAQEESSIGTTREEPQQEEEATSFASSLGVPQELQDKLAEFRKINSGRPLGRKKGNPKPRGDRATFIVDKSITRKLKYIALMETRYYKDVVAGALEDYIKRWEEQNGIIKLPKTKGK